MLRDALTEAVAAKQRADTGASARAGEGNANIRELVMHARIMVMLSLLYHHKYTGHGQVK